MESPAPGEIPVPAQRERWVFGFDVDGDLRFISHHDMLRLFARSLARAALPVRFSEGFNPHPRLSIPLPRPVGVASQAEAIVVEFEQPIDGDDALRRLEHHTPADIRMTRARHLDPAERLHPALVRYRLDLSDPPDADLHSRIEQILESADIAVERVHPKHARAQSINVRAYLVDIRIEGDGVEFTLHVTDGGTARPAEIAGLLGFDSRSINHRIRRLEVQWQQIG